MAGFDDIQYGIWGYIADWNIKTMQIVLLFITIFKVNIADDVSSRDRI